MTTTTQPLTGRFAPSPTGRMHAGNIYASLITWLLAKSSGGQIVLRIEDLDKQRSKPYFAEQIMRDYEQLGLTWDKGPFYQHERDEAYAKAYDLLAQQGLVYPCFCSRADLHAQSAPHTGEAYVYAKTCRNLTKDEVINQTKRLADQGRQPSYRLIVSSQVVEIADLVQGRYCENLALDCGDFVIRRSDCSYAYHLAVVVDDAAQGITLVSRGTDLLSSTPQQIYLQGLLGLNTPKYAHLPLLVDKTGRRLSKRNQDASMEYLIEKYHSPAGIIGALAVAGGLLESFEPITPQELLARHSFNSILEACKGSQAITWEPDK